MHAITDGDQYAHLGCGEYRRNVLRTAPTPTAPRLEIAHRLRVGVEARRHEDEDAGATFDVAWYGFHREAQG